jgi:glycosyltransferase involved in cell wall biosynthesis
MNRVLFVAPSAYLLGGVQDWLYMTCLGLRERGHEVVVGVPNGKFHDAKRYNEYYTELEAISFTNRTRTREGRIRSLSSFLLCNRADIIVGVNIGDLYQSYIRVARELGGTKFVVALHAIETNYFLDIRKNAGFIDAVITTNRLSEQMVQRIGGIEKKRTFYAPCGIEEALFGQKKWNCDYLKQINIAWVGRIESGQKRVMDLVRIVRRLDLIGFKFRLSIVGEGPSEERLKKELEYWVRGGVVRFIGRMQKEDLHHFYRENDVLLITSVWETGPIIAWEAMAAELVIVSSRYIGSRLEGALVDGETALLYEIGDDVDAVRKIQSVYDPQVRRRIIRQAKEVIRKRYIKGNSLDKWEKSLMKIAEWKKKENYDGLAIKEETFGLGRLEKVFGREVGEKLRYLIPGRQAIDAGSEWPHSCHEIIDQAKLWQHATEIENTVQASWDYNV